MVLIDVNVLVYAHRVELRHHRAFRRWLEACMQRDQVFGLCDLVLAGFVRIVTHPKIFKGPTPLEVARDAAASLRVRPNCVLIAPGPRHWDIFLHLCRVAGVKGNLVSDAYLAALAIESGCEWFTSNRDFSRFPGLRWRHSLS